MRAEVRRSSFVFDIASLDRACARHPCSTINRTFVISPPIIHFDFQIARAGGGFRYDNAVVPPGERAEFSFRLKRGTYKLWCGIADHKARGMRSKIRVR